MITISPFTCYMGKMNFCGSVCGLLEYFLQINLLPDYSCKSYDHDHKMADFVIA